MYIYIGWGLHGTFTGWGLYGAATGDTDLIAQLYRMGTVLDSYRGHDLYSAASPERDHLAQLPGSDRHW